MTGKTTTRHLSHPIAIYMTLFLEPSSSRLLPLLLLVAPVHIVCKRLCTPATPPVTTQRLLRDYPKLYLSKKNHLRSLTLAISDQNNLNNSIAHKDKSETALCELCKVKENTEHKLIHCPDLEELRYRTGYMKIGNNVLSPMETLDIKKFNEIVTKCNLFE